MSFNNQEFDYGDSNYDNSESTETPVAKITLSLIVCILGLVGNALVIFVILVLKEYKKSVTHWYVLQLAVADSLFLLTLPFKVSEDWEGRWLFSQTLCKMKETILFLNYYASILFLVVMSLDRYIAVCHRFQKHLQKLRTNSSALIITGVTWIAALLICIPVMKYSFKVGHDPNCSCSYEFPIDVNITKSCLDEGYTNETIHECLTFMQEKQNRNKNEPYCIKSEPTQELYPDYYGSTDLTGSLFSFADFPTLNTYNSQEETAISSGESVANLKHFTIVEYTTTGVATDQSISPQCNYSGTSAAWSGFLIFNFVGMFIIPFVIMTICYVLIILRLKSTRVRLQSTTSAVSQTTTAGASKVKRVRKSASRSDKDRRRVTVMCVVLVGSFGLLWLPFHANHIAKIIGIPLVVGDDTLCKVLPVVGSILAYLNSALNPYLYSFLGGSFKRRLRSVSTIIGGSIRRSSSTSGVVRHTIRNRGGSSSNDPAVKTKIYKGGKSVVSESSRQSIDVSQALTRESQEKNTTMIDKTNATPPPQYDEVENLLPN